MVASLEHAQCKVKEFHKQRPSALQPISLNAIQFISRVNYMTPMIPKKLFGWEDSKFDREYLENMNQRWANWKRDCSTIKWEEEDDSRDENLRKGVM